MRKKKENLVQILSNIEEKVKLLRENQSEGMEVVPELFSAIAFTMSAFLEEVKLEPWQQETILQRLDHLNQAYSRKDKVWLADVLQYEIVDCMNFVLENIE